VNSVGWFLDFRGQQTSLVKSHIAGILSLWAISSPSHLFNSAIVA